MKKILLLFTTALIIVGCKQNVQKNPNEKLILALYWYKHSPEKQAIYLQNFNIAKQIVSEHLKNYSSEDTPLAVITDIDETVLDNSDFELDLLRNGKEYTYELWKQWTEKAIAKAQPGAVEFSKFLKENNVELFYISNRRVNELVATIRNLQNEGFEFADSNHILLRENTSDKTFRREQVLKNYKVILYLGDNLRDFDEIFANNPYENVDKNKKLFGAKYIIFPNPMYGDWMKLKDSNISFYDALVKQNKQL